MIFIHQRQFKRTLVVAALSWLPIAPLRAAEAAPRAAVGVGFTRFGFDEKSGSRPRVAEPIAPTRPLALRRGDRVVLIGNTLFERGDDFPHFEAMLQAAHPQFELTVRTLAWSADEIDLLPRPENFGDLKPHLTAQRADVIFAAFGCNESFGGVGRLPEFRARLVRFLTQLKTSAHNGGSAPRIVLVSPIASENIPGVPAADPNNTRLAAYRCALEEVGVAGNEMAKDPDGIKRDFVPKSDKVLHATKLSNPQASETRRFKAPREAGKYPHVRTFPGHWPIMNGVMEVKP